MLYLSSFIGGGGFFDCLWSSLGLVNIINVYAAGGYSSYSEAEKALYSPVSTSPPFMGSTLNTTHGVWNYSSSKVVITVSQGFNSSDVQQFCNQVNVSGIRTVCVKVSSANNSAWNFVSLDVNYFPNVETVAIGESVSGLTRVTVGGTGSKLKYLGIQNTSSGLFVESYGTSGTTVVGTGTYGVCGKWDNCTMVLGGDLVNYSKAGYEYLVTTNCVLYTNLQKIAGGSLRLTDGEIYFARIPLSSESTVERRPMIDGGVVHFEEDCKKITTSLLTGSKGCSMFSGVTFEQNTKVCVDKASYIPGGFFRGAKNLEIVIDEMDHVNSFSFQNVPVSCDWTDDCVVGEYGLDGTGIHFDGVTLPVNFGDGAFATNDITELTLSGDGTINFKAFPQLKSVIVDETVSSFQSNLSSCSELESIYLLGKVSSTLSTKYIPSTAIVYVKQGTQADAWCENNTVYHVHITDADIPQSGDSPYVVQSTEVFDGHNPTDVEFVVYFGTKTLAATGIEEVAVNSESLRETDWSLSGTTLSIHEEYLSTLGSGTYDMSVKFNDINSTVSNNLQVSVINGVINKGPSVSGDAEFVASSPQDVSLVVDLGSGSEMATDINSVTFENNNIPFTFDGVNLVIKEEYLCTLSDGSYDMTVEFDTGAVDTFVILVSGNIKNEKPSIDTNVHIFDVDNPEDMVFTVSLGSGALAATDIVDVVVAGVKVEQNDYVFMGNALTISSDVFVGESNGVKPISVVFDTNDTSATTVTVINSKDTSDYNKPSAIQLITLEYYLDKPWDVFVPVKLGSASGVSSVSVGDEVLDTDMFSLDGECVVISSEFCETLTEGQYKISLMFDDVKNTVVDNIALRVYDGFDASEKPRLRQQYILFEGQDLALDFAPGSGSQEAHDVVGLVIDNKVYLPDGASYDYTRSVLNSLYNAVNYSDAEFEDDETEVSMSDIATGSNARKRSVEHARNSSRERVMLEALNSPTVFYVDNDVIHINGDWLSTLDFKSDEVYTIGCIFANDDQTEDVRKVLLRIPGKSSDDGELPDVIADGVIFDKDNSENVDVLVDFGSGSNAATTVKTVKIDGEIIKEFSVKDSSLCISSDVFAGLKEGDHTVSVTFDNDAKTEVVFVVKVIGGHVASIPPRITSNNVFFDKKNPDEVVIVVNLGNGEDAATGVDEVTIDSASVDGVLCSGSDVTIPISDLQKLECGKHIVEVTFNDRLRTVDNSLLTVVDSSLNATMPEQKFNYDKRNPHDIAICAFLGSSTIADVVVGSASLGVKDWSYSNNLIIIVSDVFFGLDNGKYAVSVKLMNGEVLTGADVLVCDTRDIDDTGDDKPVNPGTGDNKPVNPGTGSDKPVNPGIGGNNQGSGGGSSSGSSGSSGGSSGGSSSSSGDSSGVKGTSTSKPVNTNLDGSQNSAYRPDIPNYGGSWSQNGKGDWLYTLQDGEVPRSQWIADGKGWYWFDENGNLAYNWFLDSTGSWYMLDKRRETLGQCLYGWYYEEMDKKWYYFDTMDGHMLVGWQFIDGKWYYFTERNGGQTYFGDNIDGWVYDPLAITKPFGSMYASESTPDGYVVNSLGEWVN